MTKVDEALGLMNSMILSGESHSELSITVLKDARENYAQMQGLLAEAIDVNGWDELDRDWAARVNESLGRD